MDRANDAIQALREQGTAAHPGPDGSLIIRTLVSVSRHLWCLLCFGYFRPLAFASCHRFRAMQYRDNLIRDASWLDEVRT